MLTRRYAALRGGSRQGYNRHCAVNLRTRAEPLRPRSDLGRAGTALATELTRDRGCIMLGGIQSTSLGLVAAMTRIMAPGSVVARALELYP